MPALALVLIAGCSSDPRSAVETLDADADLLTATRELVFDADILDEPSTPGRSRRVGQTIADTVSEAISLSSDESPDDNDIAVASQRLREVGTVLGLTQQAIESSDIDGDDAMLYAVSLAAEVSNGVLWPADVDRLDEERTRLVGEHVLPFGIDGEARSSAVDLLSDGELAEAAAFLDDSDIDPAQIIDQIVETFIDNLPVNNAADFRFPLIEGFNDSGARNIDGSCGRGTC